MKQNQQRNMPGLRQSRSHQTYTDEGGRIREVIRKTLHVTSFAFGKIAQLHGMGGAPVVKLETNGGALLIKVRGKNTVQHIRVYCTHEHFDAVKASLQTSIESLGWINKEKS